MRDAGVRQPRRKALKDCPRLELARMEQLFSANLYRSGRLDTPPFQPASVRRNRMGKTTH
jgi:hypothetical protein